MVKRALKILGISAACGFGFSLFVRLFNVALDLLSEPSDVALGAGCALFILLTVAAGYCLLSVATFVENKIRSEEDKKNEL